MTFHKATKKKSKIKKEEKRAMQDSEQLDDKQLINYLDLVHSSLMALKLTRDKFINVKYEKRSNWIFANKSGGCPLCYRFYNYIAGDLGQCGACPLSKYEIETEEHKIEGCAARFHNVTQYGERRYFKECELVIGGIWGNNDKKRMKVAVSRVIRLLDEEIYVIETEYNKIAEEVNRRDIIIGKEYMWRSWYWDNATYN